MQEAIVATDITIIADVNEDDWHSVKDSKKRKQIQDKLAQRARRQRLREAKRKEKSSSQQPDSSSENNSRSSTHTQNMHALYYPDNLDLIPCTRDEIPLLPIPSLSYEIPYQLNLAGALFINGQILGLACCVLVPARSSPASPDVPQPLRPTALQLLTIHSTSIDRFPFPKMRDNYINMSSLFDDEDLTRDLLLGPSLNITAGCLPWDPRAWKMEKVFAEKWGFLFQ